MGFLACDRCRAEETILPRIVEIPDRRVRLALKREGPEQLPEICVVCGNVFMVRWKPGHKRERACDDHTVEEVEAAILTQAAGIDGRCRWPGCDRAVEARGLCHPHYSVWWRANRAAASAIEGALPDGGVDQRLNELPMELPLA